MSNFTLLVQKLWYLSQTWCVSLWTKSISASNFCFLLWRSFREILRPNPDFKAQTAQFVLRSYQDLETCSALVSRISPFVDFAPFMGFVNNKKNIKHPLFLSGIMCKITRRPWTQHIIGLKACECEEAVALRAFTQCFFPRVPVRLLCDRSPHKTDIECLTFLKRVWFFFVLL